MTEDLKRKAAKGIFWTFIDRAGSQFIGFVVTILLARMLSPAEFGLVAMASVVIAITRIFIDSGLRDSLIQKQDCTDTDYSTVFFFNMGVSVLLFVVIWFAAPFIARFFGYGELTPIIRALGLKPAIAAFAFVQTAVLHKQLQFGTIARVRIPAFMVSGVVGLAMAWYGYGVWALVVQSLLEPFFFNLLLWMVARWRPVFKFDKEVFRFHWKHGSRLLVVNAMGAVYHNIFSLIIGKFFSPAQLGYYSRADSFKSITLNNTVGLVQTVSYPVLASQQNNNELLKRTYRKILQATLLVILPIAAVLIAGAAPIIELLLTAKWLPAAPIMIVLMLALVLSPFNSINLNILKVKRRTDLLLRVDLINKSLLIVIVIVTVQLGFNYVVLTNLVMAIFALFINNYYTNKLITYTLREQLSDIWVLLIAFIVSLGGALLLQKLVYPDFLILNVFATGGMVVLLYPLIIFLFQRKFIVEVYRTLEGLRKKRPLQVSPKL